MNRPPCRAGEVWGVARKAFAVTPLPLSVRKGRPYARALPAERQSLLFSATYPKKVVKLTRQVMRNPSYINVIGDVPTVGNITQRVIEVNRVNRRPLLQHLIKEEGWKRVLIFVSSKRAARNLAAKLRRNGIQADAFHGDLPRSPVDYIHRIGRTGRAGAEGVAITFVDHNDQAHFNVIEKRTRVSVDREQVAGFERTGEAPEKKKGPPPKKGKRPSKKDKARAAAREHDATGNVSAGRNGERKRMGDHSCQPRLILRPVNR
ncbi:MAG: DEAD/DEAH box helicase [Kiritimatiellales bacterium]|nr:DEAD/DEAH box helicase [Kiritimatiellales bacterium]